MACQFAQIATGFRRVSAQKPPMKDENLDTLRAAATSLDPRDRQRFVEAVAETLRGRPDPDAGEFHRVCRAIASRFRRARSDADPADAIDGRA
jgi:hypothetical protein